jgi:hypothetical protein
LSDHRAPESPFRRSAPAGALAARPRAPALAAAAVLLSGCFSYQPTRPESVAPPEAVRVHVSPEIAAGFVEVLGSASPVLSGRLVEVTPESISLLVPVVQASAAGLRSEPISQQLVIRREDLLGFQRRELDRTRTAITVGAALAAAGFLAYQALSGPTGGGTGGPPVGGGPEARLPWPAVPDR